jgi:hypothetical protein
MLLIVGAWWSTPYGGTEGASASRTRKVPHRTDVAWDLQTCKPFSDSCAAQTCRRDAGKIVQIVTGRMVGESTNDVVRHIDLGCFVDDEDVYWNDREHVSLRQHRIGQH